MSMFNGQLTSQKRTGNSPRSDEGTSLYYLPPGATTEVPLYLPGCKSCALKTAHKVCSALGYEVPYDEDWHDQLTNSSYLLDSEFLVKLFYANFILEYISHGVIELSLFNAGAANNISQERYYEIVGCSGKTLTLKGANPKFMITGLSVDNGNWPSAAPDSLRPFWMGDAEWNVAKFGAKIASSVGHGLRVGSRVRFLQPSCLAEKNTPWITKVNPPESDDLTGVTFSVELSYSVNNAMQPYDAAYPPGDGKYYCMTFTYELFPQPFPNVQSNDLVSWTKRVVEITPADLDMGGFYTFKDTSNSDCRVLYPGMAGLNFTDFEAYEMDDGYTVPVPYGNFETTYAAGAYTSKVELGPVMTSLSITNLRLTFYVPSLAGDKDRIIWYGHCHNSQRDFSDSYNTDGDRRCTNVACSQFSEYHEKCWRPDGDKFGLPTFGQAAEPRHADMRNPVYFDSILTGIGVMLQQGLPGSSSHRNFTLVRKSWASLGQLLGGFFETVPPGFFPLKEPFQRAIFGKRITWTESGVGQHQEVIHGFAVERSYDYASTGGVTSNWDAAADLSSGNKFGFFPTAIGGWTTQHDNSPQMRAKVYPHELMGGLSLYSQDKTGSAFYTRVTKNETSKTTIVRLDPRYITEDPALGQVARKRAGAS